MPVTGADNSLLSAPPPMNAQNPAVGVASGGGPNGSWGGGGGGVTYYMPVMTVPYANTLDQVNLNWPASQDTYGKDLPLSADVNTLRYFFNLGVEYFATSGGIQQQQQQQLQQQQQQQQQHLQHQQHHLQHQHIHQQQQQQHHQQLQQQQPQYGYMTSFPQVPQTFQDKPCLQSSSVAHYSPGLPLAVSPACPTPMDCPSTGHPSGPKPLLPSHSPLSTHRPAQNGGNNPSSQGGGSSARDSVELTSQLSDSGFTSSSGDGEGDGEHGAEEDMDTAALHREDQEVEDQPQEQEQSLKVVKEKGKRKYYMYGSHKLIKPIKDIPPRFLQLLTHLKSAKERCQGQPVYMPDPGAPGPPQDPQTYHETFCGDNNNLSLNAEAQCFYPRQQFSMCLAQPPPQDSHQGFFVSASEASVSVSHPPPSLTMMPPPPPPPPYGNQLPHPPLPLPASAGATTASVMSCSVIAGSVPATSMQSSLASSLPSAPPPVPLGSMPGTAVTGAEGGSGEMGSQRAGNLDSVTGPPVYVGPSRLAPPSSSMAGVPNMPPPAHPPASGDGEKLRGVSYYVYPSQPSSLPTTITLQGSSNANMPPGQVAFLLSPPVYGRPVSCLTYPPPISGVTPGPTSSVPCPPVAVQ